MKTEKRCIVLLLLALLSASQTTAQEAAPDGKFRLSVSADRPNATYSVNEPVPFRITLSHEGKPVTDGVITWETDCDHMPPREQGTVKASDSPVMVTGKLSHPGFLRCTVKYKVDDKQTLTAVASAAIDPLKIPPSLPVPDDFDQFWNDQKAKLAAIPINLRLTPIKSPHPDLECFDIKADCIDGVPVSGYLVRPKGAAPKSLPAILSVHGAGVRSSSLNRAAMMAEKGMLALDINAHGLPNAQPKEYYDKLNAGELKGYRTAGRESRDTMYFRGMFMRVIRALDVLASQPEWDGKTLVVWGHSQGGAQSLVAGALDSRVTMIAPGVPALCDHSGQLIGRINGWPKMATTDSEGRPDPRVIEAARYYDGMNMATRVKAETIMSVGFLDGTCPPTAVYATFNNLQGPKRMVERTKMGHASPPDVDAEFMEAIARHVERMKQP